MDARRRPTPRVVLAFSGPRSIRAQRAAENVVSTGIRPQTRENNKESNNKADAPFNVWAETQSNVPGMSTLWE